VPGYLVTGILVFFGLLLSLLVYLWIPEKGSGSRKKRKHAVKRINEIDPPCYLPENITGPHETDPPGFEHKGGSRQSWRHEKIESFYRKYITPHKKVLQHAGYLKSIHTLLELLDQYGDCPSVVRLNNDREYQETRNVYDLLAKISLLDHSLNVAERMIHNLKKAKTKDPDMLMGKILAAALGHDIGKIPELIETQKYSKGDHPYVSYLVMKRVILTGDSPQQEEILNAIREHHYPVREGFTYELRKADQGAREMETEKLSLNGEETSKLVRLIQEKKVAETEAPEKKRSSSPEKYAPELLDLSWLDLDEFLSLVEATINCVEDTIHYKAFSMKNGLVYLTLDLVSETMLELAKKHNHPEVLVNADSKEKKRAIEYTVKTMLAQKGWIPSFIGKGYSGAKFTVENTSGKKSVGLYMPIHASAFPSALADLEKRKKKAPILSNISNVTPLVGKKK